MATVGGIRESGVVGGSENSLEVESLARFAVEDHNTKQNGLLKFEKVLKVKEQVVSGTIYYITLEALDGAHKKSFEAKVWVKPWAGFKEVQEFKPVA